MFNEPQSPPLSYIVYRHSRLCACGSSESFSRLYSLSLLRTRTGAGNRVRRLTAVTELSYNLPIRIIDATPETTPVCPQCAATLTLAHLPPPPLPEPEPRSPNDPNPKLPILGTRWSDPLPPRTSEQAKRVTPERIRSILAQL